LPEHSGEEFFWRLLEKRWLESADPGKGKLRTFLIVALEEVPGQGMAA